MSNGGGGELNWSSPFVFWLSVVSMLPPVVVVVMVVVVVVVSFGKGVVVVVVGRVA